jgi:hypothetical protein
MLQRSSEPAAKVHCRRSGLPLSHARSSAALTTKCDLKTRIRTHVSHGSATSEFLRQRCCRTMTFALQNYCKHVAVSPLGWVAASTSHEKRNQVTYIAANALRKHGANIANLLLTHCRNSRQTPFETLANVLQSLCLAFAESHPRRKLYLL